MKYDKQWEDCGIEPAGPAILVKPDEFMQEHKGLIEIPKTVKDKAQHAQTAGYVVKVGKTAYLQREYGDGIPWCKPGDRIAYPRYGGRALKGKNGLYRVIHDDDVLAILDDDVSFDEESLT